MGWHDTHSPANVPLAMRSAESPWSRWRFFLGLALLSYQPDRPQTNLVGVIGYLLADLLCSALGKMSYALPALAVYTAGLQFRLWRCTAVTSQAVSLGVFGLASMALLSLWYADRPAVYAGGWIGAGWPCLSVPA